MAIKKDSLVDEAAVKASIVSMEKELEILLPHLNKAQQAFGGMEDIIGQVQDLRNRIAKAKAVYGV